MTPEKTLAIAERVALLKVILLADQYDGGLNGASRKKAWRLVNEISKLIRTEIL